MVLRCFIRNCTNTEGGTNGIRFFPFPKSPNRRRSWLEKIHQAGGETKRPSTAGIVLCSAHFTKDCFRNTPGRELKHTAVPSERLSSKHDDDEELFRCLVCKEKVKRVCELLTDAHVHRNVKKQVVCGHCCSPFDTYSDLMAHLTELGFWERFVPAKKPYAAVQAVYCTYQCSVCPAVFNTPVARNQHQVKHIEKIMTSVARVQGPVRDCEDRSDASQSRKTEPRRRRSRRERADPSSSRHKHVAKSSLSDEGARVGREEAEANRGESRSHRVALHRSRSEPAWKRFLENAKGRLPNRQRKLECQRKQKWSSSRNKRGRPPSLHKPLCCSFCHEKFGSLKLLSRHTDTKHPDADTPLELTCEVDQDYKVLPGGCLFCRTRESCIRTLQELLDETDSDMETVTHDDVAQGAPFSTYSSKWSGDTNTNSADVTDCTTSTAHIVRGPEERCGPL